MITSKIDGQQVNMKKSEIISYITSKKPEEIRKAIEHIKENEELKRIEKFSDYCDWTLTKLDEASIKEGKHRTTYEGLAQIYLPNLRKIIENHGIPKIGHLDDYAERIIKLLDGNYSQLLEAPEIRKSYDNIKNHVKEKTHSQTFERDLNYLHEILGNIYRAKHSQQEQGINKKFSLELLSASA